MYVVMAEEEDQKMPAAATAVPEAAPHKDGAGGSGADDDGREHEDRKMPATAAARRASEEGGATPPRPPTAASLRASAARAEVMGSIAGGGAGKNRIRKKRVPRIGGVAPPAAAAGAPLAGAPSPAKGGGAAKEEAGIEAKEGEEDGKPSAASAAAAEPPAEAVPAPAPPAAVAVAAAASASAAQKVGAHNTAALDERIARKSSLSGVSSAAASSASASGAVGALDERVERKQMMMHSASSQSSSHSLLSVTPSAGGDVAAARAPGAVAVSDLDEKIARKVGSASRTGGSFAQGRKSSITSSSGGSGFAQGRKSSITISSGGSDDGDHQVARKQKVANYASSQSSYSLLSVTPSAAGDADSARVPGAVAVSDLDEKIARKVGSASRTGGSFAQGRKSSITISSGGSDDDGGYVNTGARSRSAIIGGPLSKRAVSDSAPVNTGARSVSCAAGLASFSGGRASAARAARAAAAAAAANATATDAGNDGDGDDDSYQASAFAQSALDERIARTGTGSVSGGDISDEDTKLPAAPAAHSYPAVGAVSVPAADDPARAKEGWVDDAIFRPDVAICHDDSHLRRQDEEEEAGHVQDGYHHGNGAEYNDNHFVDNDLEKDRAAHAADSKNDGLSVSFSAATTARVANTSSTDAAFAAAGGAPDAEHDNSVEDDISKQQYSCEQPQSQSNHEPNQQQQLQPSMRSTSSFRLISASTRNHAVVDADVALANPDLLENEFKLSSTDKRNIFIGLILIIVIIVAITVPVVLIKSEQNELPSTPAPTSSPTSGRVFEFEPILAKLVQETGTPQSQFEEEGTPQAEALDWIVYRDPARLGVDSRNLVQRYALMVIYYGSGGLATRLEWESATGDECGWVGVACEDENLSLEEDISVSGNDENNQGGGIVTSLQLKDSFLDGTLVTEVGLLKDLQTLNIEMNDFTGTIPESLFDMTNLEHFNADTNGFESRLDAKVGNLVKLQTLALSNNRFTGDLPSNLGNLANLRKLYLHTNSFSGPLFDYMLRMPLLEEADNSINLFTGTIPPAVGNLSRLRLLLIQQNQFTGELPTELGELTALEIFVITDNFMRGSIPTEVGNLQNLTYIHMARCGLESTIPTEFGRLEKCTYLDMAKQSIRGTLPTELGAMSSLEFLALHQNFLTGTIPTELGNLKHLELMYLQRNDLRGSVGEEICALREDPFVLEEFRVDCLNKITCPPECCTFCK